MSDAEPAPPTTALRVREEIQRAIVTGALAPGERLTAEALAHRFGTSRTPIREALLSLEAEGLVELYELRAVIEPYAAARAAERIGPDTLAALDDNCAKAAARGGA